MFTFLLVEIEMRIDKADKSVLGTTAEVVLTKESTTKVGDVRQHLGRSC